MSVLVFAESSNGKLKKASFETIYYAGKVAAQLGTEAVVVALGDVDADELSGIGKLGVNKVVHVSDSRFNNFDSKPFAKAIAQVADSVGANVVIMPFSFNGKALGPRIAARIGAGFVSGVTNIPESNGEFVVRKGVFSGKGYADFIISSDKKVISLQSNSFPVIETEGTATVEAGSVDVTDADFAIEVIGVEANSGGGVPLPEADLVVSAGRGLKGPENWGMIEEMAEILGAATACSRAVTDADWRPHNEHVGQTGLAITPNLYIAIAISGAIQHLAGVNRSKTIVVINNDPEAPFFKSADYGIVGDAFEVVPKLNEAFKKYLG